MLSYDHCTYGSDTHGPISLLDHVICSRDMHNLNKYVYILDKSPSSDHLPLSSDHLPLSTFKEHTLYVIKWSDVSRVSLDKSKKLT